MHYQNKTILITGASSGIGESFAFELAKRGANLILVARSGDKLKQMAADITAKHKVTVNTLAIDLQQSHAGQAVKQAVDKLKVTVDVLINNAGFGTHGPFVKLDAAREQDEIALNVSALTDLTHAFLPAMVAQQSGAVINVASTASFQPTPYMAVYGATKAYVLSLTEALAEENRKLGVKFIAVCPGPVETNFFNATGNPKLRQSLGTVPVLTPEEVVISSLDALAVGKVVFVPGIVNKLGAQSAAFIPRKLMTRISGKMIGGKR